MQVLFIDCYTVLVVKGHQWMPYNAGTIHRLLHGLSLMALGLSVVCETWPPMNGQHHPIVIDMFNSSSQAHLSLVPHIYASANLVSIGSDNGLSPRRYQAIIWTNAGILLIGPLGTNFSEILIKRQNFSFTKMQLKVLSVMWRPFCPEGDELIQVRTPSVTMVCMLIWPGISTIFQWPLTVPLHSPMTIQGDCERV